jgi:uncharacterized protein YecT (DUF1311 family)
MRQLYLLTLTLIPLACLAPASALDCRQASSSVDKLICATPQLKKADGEMGAAYFELLKETTDADFHEALIKSQRRWLKVRSGGPDRFGQAQDDKTDDREILLGVTRQRLTFLRSGDPVRTMERQRTILSGDSGGAFEGFQSTGVLQPPPYGSWPYECWGDAHRQNKNRVCSSVREWASGHMTESRRVSVVQGGELKFVASCASAGEDCPDGDNRDNAGSASHWNTNPTQPVADPQMADLWKYDPDIEPEVIDQKWMHDCLFAPVYPPPEARRPGAAPKP